MHMENLIYAARLERRGWKIIACDYIAGRFCWYDEYHQTNRNGTFHYDLKDGRRISFVPNEEDGDRAVKLQEAYAAISGKLTL